MKKLWIILFLLYAGSVSAQETLSASVDDTVTVSIDLTAGNVQMYKCEVRYDHNYFSVDTVEQVTNDFDLSIFVYDSTYDDTTSIIHTIFTEMNGALLDTIDQTLADAKLVALKAGTTTIEYYNIISYEFWDVVLDSMIESDDPDTTNPIWKVTISE